MTLIAADRMVLAEPGGSRLAGPGYVRLDGATIAEVGTGTPPAPPDVALSTGVLAPGLVDLQVNGAYGVDLAGADAAGWARVAARLPSTGVTAFQATFITAPVAVLVAALRAAPPPTASPRAAAPPPPGVPATPPGVPATRAGTARLLGVHVEGPFLSPAHPGAHRTEWMIDPLPEAVAELLGAAPVPPATVTLAPERAGALAAIETLAAAGVLVSVGHTDATAEQVHAAADAGARMVTHLFNAQRGLHHREPGVPGAALTDDRLTCGLIADLHHVSADVCRLAFAAAPGRICLVTDAVAATGMPPGRYELGGEPIDLPAEEGAPPRRPDGVLAGSGLRLDRAVANLAGLGIDLALVIDAATRVPADLIGRADLGRIAPGAAADLVWLDAGLRAARTWVAGRLGYDRADQPAGGGRAR